MRLAVPDFFGLEKKVTKKLTSQQRQLWEVLVFLARFAVLAAPLHFLLWLNLDARLFQEMTATATAGFLSVFRPDVWVEGTSIFINSVSGLLQVEIIRECLGWKSWLALAGLMFAVRRVPMKVRLLGIAMGVPVILAGNLIRLTTTVWATAEFGFQFFEVVHSMLWQWGLVFLVLGFWVYWLRVFVKPPRA